MEMGVVDLFLFFVVFVLLTINCISDSDITISFDGSDCWNRSCGVEFNPYSPLINCSYV